jgi:hypothetical protein
VRLSALVREAAAGIRSGTSRAGFLFLAMLAANFAYIGLDGAELTRIEERYLQYTQHGGTTFQTTAVGGINGATCERLNEARGVVAAAALRFDRRVFPLTLPRTPFDVVSATPSFIAQIEVVEQNPSSDGGVFVEESLAERLGVGVGDEILTTPGGGLRVIGIHRLGWDDPILTNAFIEVVLPTGPFDRCLVRLESPGVDGRLLSLMAAETQSAPVVSTLNPNLGDAPNFSLLVVGRSTSPLLYLPAAIGLAVSLSIVIRRSLELSTTANFGVRRVDMVAILLLEAFGVACLTALAVLGPWLLVGVSLQTPMFRQFLDAQVISAIILGTAGMLAGPLAASFFIARKRYLRAFRLR